MQHTEYQKDKWLKGISFLFIGSLYFYIKFFYHEFWKDEWQPWLLAKGKSFPDLFSFLSEEGHPMLWFCYLKIWTPFSELISYEELGEDGLFKIAHGVLFIIALYQLLYKFTMPLLLRIAVACSFFFFFEYGIVTRGYILLIVICFALVSVLNVKGGRQNWVVGILLFLLCQTEVYGVFMAIALLLFCAYTHYEKHKTFHSKEHAGLWLPALAVFLGGLIFTLSVFPDEGREVIGMNVESTWVANFSHAIQGNFTNTFWIGILPDTNAFGYSIIGVSAAFLLIGLMAGLLYKDKGLLIAFAAYQLAAVLFDAFVYQGGVRHWGMNFIFLIVVIELLHRRAVVMDTKRWLLLGSFLICQFYYNFQAISKELKHPFSNAKITAEFLKEKVPEKVPIVAINKFETAPVGAYLGRALYELPDGVPFTYYQWLDKVYLPQEAELKLFAQYKKVAGLVIISPKPLDPRRYPNSELWKAFDQYSIKKENYYVYTLTVK